MAEEQENQKDSLKSRQNKFQDKNKSSIKQREIDLTSAEDQRRFRTVCEQLWTQLYEVDCKARNHPFYHSCCNCFSKRTFALGKHNHPEECTFRFVDWIKMNEICDAESFHQYLFDETKLKPANMQTLPGLNIHHGSDDSVQKVLASIQARVSLLEKRNIELEAELERSKREHSETKGKLAELEERLRRETEERKFAELLNQVNKQLEKHQDTKVRFDYDTKPQKSLKKW